MSSWKELYDDFKDQTQNYTEKVTVTENMFMRYISKGAQSFQRDTNYMESVAELARGRDQGNNEQEYFDVPYNLLIPIELQDSSGLTILPQSYGQFRRNIEVGGRETPFDYTIPFSPERANGDIRIYTIFGRRLEVYPLYDTDTSVTLKYIPDLDAFSEVSQMWASFFPIETNFDHMFTNTGLPLDLRPYEDGILSYAISKFIKRQGNANYKVYEDEYRGHVKLAMENKPTLFTEGVRDYKMAPWS